MAGRCIGRFGELQMLRDTKLWLAAGVAAAAVVLAPTGSVAAGTCQQKSSGCPSASSATATGTAASVLERKLRLMRRPRRAGDLPPISGQAWVRHHRLWVSKARRARVVGKRGVYLIPGRRRACLYFGRRYGGFACTSPSRAAAGRLNLTEVLAQGSTHLWILPDGARDLKLTINGAPGTTPRIVNNAVVVVTDIADAEVQLRWTDRAGRVHTG